MMARARQQGRFSYVAIPRDVSLLLLVVIWEVAGRMTESRFLPEFTVVVSAWIKLAVHSSVLWNALAQSMRALALGLALAIPVGVIVGLVMGRSAFVRTVLDMYLSALLSVPLAALVPALMAIFGIGEATVAVTVFVFAVGVITVNAKTGAENVPPGLIEMARSYNATPVQVFRKIVLPSAVPQILTGITLGVNQAVKGMVVGEMLIVTVGIGERLVSYQSFFRIPETYATVLTILLLAYVLTKVTKWMETRLIAFRTGG